MINTNQCAFFCVFGLEEIFLVCFSASLSVCLNLLLSWYVPFSICVFVCFLFYFIKYFSRVFEVWATTIRRSIGVRGGDRSERERSLIQQPNWFENNGRSSCMYICTLIPIRYGCIIPHTTTLWGGNKSHL